jgi:hypothetical protein
MRLHRPIGIMHEAAYVVCMIFIRPRTYLLFLSQYLARMRTLCKVHTYEDL